MHTPRAHAHVRTHTRDGNRFVDTADYSKDYSGHAKFAEVSLARDATPEAKNFRFADSRRDSCNRIREISRVAKVCDFSACCFSIRRSYVFRSYGIKPGLLRKGFKWSPSLRCSFLIAYSDVLSCFVNDAASRTCRAHKLISCFLVSFKIYLQKHRRDLLIDRLLVSVLFSFDDRAVECSGNPTVSSR